MQSRGISRKLHMWHFQFSYLIEVLIWRGTFCWKPHLNRSNGSEIMSNWRILRTIENNRNSFLFLAISHNQCCRLPTDPTRLPLICCTCSFMCLVSIIKKHASYHTKSVKITTPFAMETQIYADYIAKFVWHHHINNTRIRCHYLPW